MKEKDIQTIFRDNNHVFGIFELKLCKGTSLPFDAVKEHQRQALLNVSRDVGIFFKIPDSPVFTGSKMRFSSLKPFDCFHLAKIPAYVVICFYQPRKFKRFYYIPISTFLELEQETERKSITMEMAKQYSEVEMEI